jgi:hypothetical protein
VIDASDLVVLLNYLYIHGPTPRPFLDQGDLNNDDEVDASDLVYLMNYLFAAGPVPIDKNRFLPQPWRGKFTRSSLFRNPNW